MRSRRLLVSAIGAVLSLSAAVALANAGPPQAPPERLKTTADSIQVRLMYGLRADRAFVESLGQVASPLLGIPLSKSEQAEMERRKRVQDSLDPLKAYAQSADALFAGMFIDQAAGGILDIALTAAAPQSVRNDLLSIAPREAAVRFRTVSFSMAELQSVRNELQKLAATEPQDVQSGIGAISTDVRSNVVRVAVSAADRPVLEPALVSTFGDRIAVVDDFVLQNEACTSRSSCTPYRAGIQIYPPGSSGYCTTGFTAKKNGAANYYLLTAGHCGLLNSAWLHDEVQVGLVKIRAYANGGATDAAAISRPGTAGHKNWIFVTNGEKSRTVTARQGQDADSVGESVCLSGVTSGFSCGTITDVDVDNVFDGSITQNNLRTANYISTGGDSGSPIFYGNTAKGIHKGSLGSVKFYSHIWEVESALGVKVLVAPT